MSSPGTGGPPQRSAPAGAEVGATLREMWHTRPSRRRDDRKVAGVAAAIARRYGVDPTLVRIAFVVAAFYGVGLLVYLAGWLVLPRADRPDERHGSARVAIAGVLVGVVAVGPLLGGRAGGAVGLIVVLALLYALHRSRAALGHRDDPEAPAPEARPVGDGEPEDGEPRPPAWDPLGAAPFAWDLPEPAAATPPRPPRSPLAPATIGLALLAGAAVLTLGLVGLLPVGVTPVAATMLAVVGTGLVVGAFRHRGRSLIIAALPLALVLVGAAGGGPRGGPPWLDDDRGFADPATSRVTGAGSWSPAGAAAVAPIYQTVTGSARLDLGGVAPGGPPVRTTVRSATGSVTVIVPQTADVTAECRSGGGAVTCLGHGEGDLVDDGPDGPGGPVIDLRAMSGAGAVEVRRG